LAIILFIDPVGLMVTLYIVCGLI